MLTPAMPITLLNKIHNNKPQNVFADLFISHLLSKILDVNMSGVTGSLKRLNITPNKVKTGPKPKILL